MFIGFLSYQRRVEIAQRLRRLGQLESFLEFCRVLNSGGVTLQVVQYNIAEFPHQLAMSVDGALRGFCEFGIAEELAQWIGRWDQLAYSIPLSRDELTLLVARERWMREPNWEHDLPAARWPDFRRFVIQLGFETTEAVTNAMFYHDCEQPDVLPGIARTSGIPVTTLIDVFGPRTKATAHAA